jgi:hypothetical protein
MAGQVVRGGFKVVFDGVMGPWFLPTFFEATGVHGLHYAVLLPSVDRCVGRARAGKVTVAMGPGRGTSTNSARGPPSTPGTCCLIHRIVRGRQPPRSCPDTAEESLLTGLRGIAPSPALYRVTGSVPLRIPSRRR